MFIEDITSAGVNIAVDVPEAAALNFLHYCRMFESDTLSRLRVADEYLMTVQQAPSSTVDLTDDDDAPSAKRVALQWDSPTKQRLTDVIMANIEVILREIPRTAVELVSRTALRVTYERDIVTCLERQFGTHFNALQLMPFGSATYGFGGPDTDFNILLNMGR